MKLSELSVHGLYIVQMFVLVKEVLCQNFGALKKALSMSLRKNTKL